MNFCSCSCPRETKKGGGDGRASSFCNFGCIHLHTTSTPNTTAAGNQVSSKQRLTTTPLQRRWRVPRERARGARQGACLIFERQASVTLWHPAEISYPRLASVECDVRACSGFDRSRVAESKLTGSNLQNKPKKSSSESLFSLYQ